MRFIEQNTQIRVLCRRLSREVGPFTIIDYVENRGCMSDPLTMPVSPTEYHMLDPDISEDALESFYGKAAVHLLRLFKPSFSRMGP